MRVNGRLWLDAGGLFFVSEGALVGEVGAGGDGEGGGVVGAGGVEGHEVVDDEGGEREFLVAERLDDEARELVAAVAVVVGVVLGGEGVPQ